VIIPEINAYGGIIRNPEFLSSGSGGFYRDKGDNGDRKHISG
jgi:hypothetical protein